MNEVWRTVQQNHDYEVSSLGNVRSLKSGKPIVLKTFVNKMWGYMRINLVDSGKVKQVQVHRLVAEAFIGSIDGKFINHINGTKTDNRVENLEIVTQQENVQHSIYVLGNSLKPVLQFDLNGDFIRQFSSIKEASLTTGTQNTSISKCCTGVRSKAGGFKWRYNY